MRHQAGDDVVVVSRPSLTKSLLRVPVRPRSPGWTRRSSFPHHPSCAKIASWIRGRIEAEGGCCCQPWGRVSLGVCGNDLVLVSISFQIVPYRIWGEPRQRTIALLSNRDRFRTVWSTLVQRSPSQETFGSTGTNLGGPGSRVGFARVAARTRSSVIPFDTFDRWRLGTLGRGFKHDRSVGPRWLHRSCCGSAGRRSSRR
ncbi:hypothetical protein DBV15_07299 [Temnothorax longispinosus]|uniref:Uncharacterized protein n=1 Tax=Temnothorax longispinosus TaxID=300112 RepID=A0A4S2KSB1_9HYME|nr:hypothetical protein DBV15_07299 [Temnothorax longispinosus]